MIIDTEPGMKQYLKPTRFIDCDNQKIRTIAEQLSGGESDVHKKAKQIFYYVRDELPYNYLCPFYYPENYIASKIVSRGSGFCVQKAVVFVALARAVGIASRLVFADIRNHLTSQKLIQILGGNLFVYHGYCELFLDGRWIRVTPTFDKRLCLEAGYPLVEFDGYDDAVFPRYDEKGRKFIEYVRAHGSYPDVPFEEIVEAWKKAYGKENVELWKFFIEKMEEEGKSG